MDDTNMNHHNHNHNNNGQGKMPVQYVPQPYAIPRLVCNPAAYVIPHVPLIPLPPYGQNYYNPMGYLSTQQPPHHYHHHYHPTMTCPMHHHHHLHHHHHSHAHIHNGNRFNGRALNGQQPQPCTSTQQTGNNACNQGLDNNAGSSSSASSSGWPWLPQGNQGLQIMSAEDADERVERNYHGHHGVQIQELSAVEAEGLMELAHQSHSESNVMMPAASQEETNMVSISEVMEEETTSAEQKPDDEPMQSKAPDAEVKSVYWLPDLRPELDLQDENRVSVWEEFEANGVDMGEVDEEDEGFYRTPITNMSYSRVVRRSNYPN